MFPKYRHAPILDPLRKRCPVCNHVVYSLSGVHPQCAIRLLEPQPTATKKPMSEQEAPIDVASPVPEGRSRRS